MLGFSNAQKWIVPVRPQVAPEHDIRFGIGYKPIEAAAITFFDDDWWFDEERKFIDFDANDYYSGARYTTNALFGEYIYQANKWFGVGATLTYFAYFNGYYDVQSDARIGMNIAQHISIYPTVRLTWVNNPGFRIYSSFGLRTRIVSETNRLNSDRTNELRNSISGQMTVFGITVGKRIYGFSDLSTIGTQGFLNVGIGCRFNKTHK